MLLHRYISLALILLATSLVVTYWYFDRFDDNKTVIIQKMATIKNQSGFGFSVYRHPSERNVWIRFTLPENSVEQFDKDNPPVIWIGDGAPRYMATSKEFQASLNAVGSDLVVYEWRPNQIAVVVWHGIAEEGYNQDIIDLLQGDQIKVRYFLRTGTAKETSFSLKGMADPIAQAIDIGSTTDLRPKEAAPAL